MNQVIEFFKKIWDSSDWPARWHCGSWTDFHGWLYIISDLLIWSAYFAIPLVIIKYIFTKKSIQFTKLYFLFAAFILACGATHFLDAVAFWLPLYRLSALARFVTGVISWVTVFYLVKYLPVIFSLRSQAALEAEIEERKKTEAALKRSRKDFELLVDGVKDYAIFRLDKEGKIASWNKGAEHVKGYTAEEIIGQPVEVLYLMEDRHRGEAARNLQQAREHGRFETEGWRVKKDGSSFWADVTITPLYDLDKQWYGYVKVTRDNTEKRKNDERIRFLATIARNIQDPVIVTDRNLNITQWNDAAEKTFEWKSEEVIGKKTADILQTVYPKESREQILQAFTEIEFWQGEVIYHSKSGNAVNVLATVSYLKDGENTVTGNLILARDITARKKAEFQLKEFEHFFNNSNDFSCIADLKGYFEVVNASFNKVLGYTEEELIKKPFIDFVHPDDREATEAAYQQLKSGATVMQFINRYRTKEGSYLWLEWNATPNQLSGKQYCIARDITDKKKAEDALNKLNEELEQRVKQRTAEIEKNENRFRALIENNHDMISLLDDKFKVFYRSPSASRITGWTDDDIMNSDSLENIHVNDRESTSALIRDLMANNGKPFNTLFRSLHKNGHYIWLEGTVINLLHDENVKAIVFNFRDVTARIEAKEKLAASELQFRSLIENSSEGITLSDEFSNILYRSPSSVKIAGGAGKENIFSCIHPDDDSRIKDIMKEVMNRPGEPVAFEARFKHAAGHYYWLEGTLTNMLHIEGVNAVVSNYHDITERKRLEDLLQKANTLARIGSWELDLVKETIYWSDITREIHETNSDYVPDLANAINFYKEGAGRDLIVKKVTDAIELGQSWDEELQIITAKNNERWIRTIGETEFLDGKCVRIYGSFQDIDQRKTIQEKIKNINVELEEKVVHRTEQLRNTNAELEAFTYSVSHDLRAPLRAIHGYTKILIAEYETNVDAEGRRLMNKIVDNARKMGQLIDDLLAFSRLGRHEILKMHIPMAELVSNICSELEKEQPGRRIKFTMKNVLPAKADNTAIKQVWLNLLSNAVKYSRHQDPALIEIASEIEGQDIVYCVKDNGAGFDMRYADKLFGVFQRLHSEDEFEGTGVGLAIVQRIIVKHGGRVWAEGKVNEGAAFYFSLPINILP